MRDKSQFLNFPNLKRFEHLDLDIRICLGFRISCLEFEGIYGIIPIIGDDLIRRNFAL